MNKTPATEFIRGIKAYCKIVRKMSKGGTLSYLKNLRKQLIESEAIQTDILVNTNDKIRAIDKWMKELEQ